MYIYSILFYYDFVSHSQAAKRPMSAVGKSSIFTTSEEAGAKVGVTNSGKGVTEYSQRKKHKF